MKKSERSKKHTSKDDALTDKEINLLTDNTQTLKEKFIIKMILYSGLRAGEIAHIKKDWINEDKTIINIPTKQECTCYECRLRRFSQIIEDTAWKKDYPDITFSVSKLEKILHKKRSITEKEKEYQVQFSRILVGFWEPKTHAGIREIPIIYPELNDVIDKFFSHHEQLNISRQRVWFIVQTVAKRAGLYARTKVKGKEKSPSWIYPHALRATCASLWGKRGVALATMCKVFGWDDVTSANPYVTIDKKSAEKELREKAGKSFWGKK